MKYQANPNTPNWEKFEEHFERCLNDYWDRLTPLEKTRYVQGFFSHQEQEVKEETLSCRLLWERLGEWNKEWQAENPKERKLHFNDSLKLIEWKMGKTKQEVKKEMERQINEFMGWMNKTFVSTDSPELKRLLNEGLERLKEFIKK